MSNEDIVDAFEIDDIPDDKIVVLCTGSQGEPLSALARMANGEHKSLTITARDTVIISATPVPGNEKSVQAIINSLSRIGCDIYDKSNALVHVSGHGSQEELKLMLAMTNPTYFMPVHGEAVHLRAHAKLAQEMGMKEDHIFVVESGIVYVDGLRIGDTEPAVLRDRQKLARDGIVTCVVTVSSRARKVGEIDISCRGVSFANDDALISDASDAVKEAIANVSGSGVSADSLRKTVRNCLSNFLWGQTHTRPMIIPVVMEV